MTNRETHSVTQMTRTTLFWLTGWSMSDAVFDSLREELLEFHHIRADYSTADSPESIIALTKAKAEQYKTGPLLIVGWSLGGLLALCLAAEGVADGIVLIASTACFVRSKEEIDLGWPIANIRKMIALVVKNRNSALLQFRRTLFTEAEWEAGFPASLSLANDWTTPALIAGLQLLSSIDIRPQLPGIGCPALLLHGSEDKVCPYRAAEELEEQLQEAKLIKIAESGHAPFLGRERQTADTIRSWWHERQIERHSATV